MRFTTLFYGIVASTSYAIVAATASSKHQAQQPIQVYLHPSPPSSHNLEPPTLTPDQAEAVLAHHFSAGEGVDEYEKLPGGHEGWAHLLSGGLFGGDGRGQRKEEDKARVVIVQGDIDVECEWLVVPCVSEIPLMVTSTTNQPSFQAISPPLPRSTCLLRPKSTPSFNPTSTAHPPSSTTSSLLFLPHRNSSTTSSTSPPPVRPSTLLKTRVTLQLISPHPAKTEATQALSEQLQALSAIASRVPWTDRSRPPSDRWEAVKVKLSKGKEDDDIDFEVQKEGRNVVKAALEVVSWLSRLHVDDSVIERDIWLFPTDDDRPISTASRSDHHAIQILALPLPFPPSRR
jgi:hypothetical protein